MWISLIKDGGLVETINSRSRLDKEDIDAINSMMIGLNVKKIIFHRDSVDLGDFKNGV